jgi:hypothetical protein
MATRVHQGSKKEWKLLHADQDLERFIGRIADWDEPYPEPIILDM